MSGKKEVAYSIIKNKIIDGELKPMESISENDLADELKISRMPIHQALLLLKEEGFVYIYPRKGTIVADLTMDTIHWIFETRALLEPHIFKNACSKLPMEWLKKMYQAFRDVINTLEKSGGSDELIQRSITLDQELHNTICESCPNKFIRDIMVRINDYNQWLRTRISFANIQYKHSVEVHMEILDALIRNEPEEVERITLAHIIQSEEEAYMYNK